MVCKRDLPSSFEQNVNMFCCTLPSEETQSLSMSMRILKKSRIRKPPQNFLIALQHGKSAQMMAKICIGWSRLSAPLSLVNFKQQISVKEKFSSPSFVFPNEVIAHLHMNMQRRVSSRKRGDLYTYVPQWFTTQVWLFYWNGKLLAVLLFTSFSLSLSLIFIMDSLYWAVNLLDV